MTDYVIPRLLRGETDPGFSIELQLKDHRLAAELGRSVGVPLFLNGLAIQLYELMVAQGQANKDVTQSVLSLADLAGVNVLAPDADLSAGTDLVHVSREGGVPFLTAG